MTDIVDALRAIARQGRIGGGTGVDALAYIQAHQAEEAADTLERLRVVHHEALTLWASGVSYDEYAERGLSEVVNKRKMWAP